MTRLLFASVALFALVGMSGIASAQQVYTSIPNDGTIRTNATVYVQGQAAQQHGCGTGQLLKIVGGKKDRAGNIIQDRVYTCVPDWRN